jgi:hypothetical protein
METDIEWFIEYYSRGTENLSEFLGTFRIQRDTAHFEISKPSIFGSP